MTRVAFIGFGEVASALCTAIAARGAEIAAPAGGGASALEQKAEMAK